MVYCTGTSSSVRNYLFTWSYAALDFIFSQENLQKITIGILESVSTKQFDDFIPLVDVVAAREEDLAPNHLSEDASHRPDIHVLLVSHAEYHFGRPVVSGHHIRGHHEVTACTARQPEIQDFQCAIRAHHDVRRLQVLLRARIPHIIHNYFFGY